jgi:adenosylhomocysteine nucleosidase
MPIDGGGAAAVDAAAAPVTVLVALGVERTSLVRARAGLSGGLAVVQTGPGPAAAARAATIAVAAGCRALVSFGLAGALVPLARAGTVVLPRHVRGADGTRFATDGEWRDSIAALLGAKFATADGDLLSVTAPLATAANKSRAADVGAIAVDMESAAIAAVAARAGAACVAIRVIVDEAADSLPSGAERFVDERGEQRLAVALGAALRPSEWRAFMTLARRYRTARRTLDEVAAELVAQRFCPPAEAVPAKGH